MGWIESFRRFFGDWAETAPPIPPPAVPAAITVSVPAQDPPELVPAVEPASQAKADRGPEGFIADLTCVISYVDAQGEPSVRRVSIRQVVKQSGRTYLAGYCHEARGPRQFRLDRVGECWDCNTGEVIELAAWIATLQPELGIRPPKRPGRPFARKVPRTEDGNPEKLIATDDDRLILARCGEGIRVLRFLSLCDGAEVEAERRVIREFAALACDGVVVSMDPIWFESRFVTAVLHCLRPDKDSFLLAADAVARQGQPMAMWLAQCAVKLIRADGVVHQVESESVDELIKLLDRG